MSQSSFVDALLPKGFGRNARLERIAGLLDWRPLEVLVLRVRKGDFGRPPYAALAMLKALLLQQWYGLSDPGLEEALLDRVSFRRFCGFALDADTPDETTLCRFRNDMKDAGLGEALFAEVNRQLDARGLILRQGTLVDATLIESALRAPPSGSTARSTPEVKGVESSNPLDPDANWTRRGAGRRLFFGYKAHVGMDKGSDIIRSRQMTGGKMADGQCADGLIMGDEAAVYADKAYDKKERRAALKARGVKDRIQHRRNRHQAKLPRWQTVRNILIGRVRGAVERVLSQFKGPYGLRRMRYRGLKANAFHLDLVVIAYNLNRLHKLA